MAKSRHGQRRGGSLRRDVAVRTPKRTFLVFCEGEKTEPAYLKALKRDPAVRDVASVDIRVDEETSGSVPLTLVEAVAKARPESTCALLVFETRHVLLGIERASSPSVAPYLRIAKLANLNLNCFAQYSITDLDERTAIRGS